MLARHAHDPRLAHQRIVLGPVEHNGHEPRPEVVELRAGVAQARELDDRLVAQVQQVNLAQLRRRGVLPSDPGTAGARQRVIVTDTHARFCWLSGDPSPSAPARAALDHAFEDAALGVFAISVWEATMLVKEGRLALELPLADLVAHRGTLGGPCFLSVTPRIALASVALDPLHADPADRQIATTALAHGTHLVTKDERLRHVEPSTSLW